MSPIKMDRLESAIRAAVKYTEIFNRHDVHQLLALLSDDCVFEAPRPAPGGTVFSGKDEIGSHVREAFQNSPAAGMEIEEIIGFGHRCVLRWKYYPKAENKNDYIRGVDIFSEKNGLICGKLSYVKGE